MAGSTIFVCFLFWSLLSLLIVPCLGQTTAVILPHLQGDLTSEGGTGDPAGMSNQTAAAGDGANMMGSTSLLQILGLLPGNPGPPTDFSGSDSTEPTTTVSGGDDNGNITEDDVLEAKVAEVLRRLTHQDASRGQSVMEGQPYYGAYASRSELPRGKCLIAIIWEAAQPSGSPEQLLAFLEDIQGDLWDMEEDLMEDVMYSDVFAEDYYYEDELDDGSDKLTDETNPDYFYYSDDVPEDSDFKEFSEGSQKDKNDHLLLFAPWMH